MLVDDKNAFSRQREEKKESFPVVEMPKFDWSWSSVGKTMREVEQIIKLQFLGEKALFSSSPDSGGKCLEVYRAETIMPTGSCFARNEQVCKQRLNARGNHDWSRPERNLNNRLMKFVPDKNNEIADEHRANRKRA